MQYVGQTFSKFKTRFGEHSCEIKNYKKIDTFLHQHFKRTDSSPTIKRIETELEWMKLLQSASPLAFNENIYH